MRPRPPEPVVRELPASTQRCPVFGRVGYVLRRIAANKAAADAAERVAVRDAQLRALRAAQARARRQRNKLEVTTP